MEKLTGFVQQHMTDDVARLVLDKGKWPDIDMDMAVNCIESRRKLKGKVQEWYDEPGLVFPRKLSAEQCSSSATGLYKASLAAAIVGKESRIADLTGGLGVDSWYFSGKASEVLYCEMLPELCEAARHNFGVLGAGNITVMNCAVTGRDEAKDTSTEKTPQEILTGFRPDMVFMDPARRGEGGRKVFLLEDCTPDVLTLKDEIFSVCRHLLLKLSPMADISMVCSRLGQCCREVHVVASGGECKELLVWMDREWMEEYSVKAVELHKDGTYDCFTFIPSEESQTVHNSVSFLMSDIGTGSFHLFEPGKALMKAGAFNLLSSRFGIGKLGKSTHYYIFDGNCHELTDNLKRIGKVYRVMSCRPLDKRNIKAVSKEYPRAEVTARNIPMDTDTLRKRLGTASSDNIHIFGLRSDSLGPVLLVTSGI